jgi:hypothetical protein
MGALTAALAVPGGRITGVKGVFTIDGALSLLAMFTNATYTSAIVAAYSCQQTVQPDLPL